MEAGPNRDDDLVVLNFDNPGDSSIIGGRGTVDPVTIPYFPPRGYSLNPGPTLSIQNGTGQAVMSGPLQHKFYFAQFSIALPGTNVAGVSNRQILYGAARVAGGLSTTNTGIFFRPSANSFRRWAEITGDVEYKMFASPGVKGMLARTVELEKYNFTGTAPMYQNAGDQPGAQGNTPFAPIFTPTFFDPAALPAQPLHNLTLIGDIHNRKFGANPAQVKWWKAISDYVNVSPYMRDGANVNAPGNLLPLGVVNYMSPGTNDCDVSDVCNPFSINDHLTYNQRPANFGDIRQSATRSSSSREYLTSTASGDPNPVVFRDQVDEIDYGVNGRKLMVIYKATVLQIDWKKKRPSSLAVAEGITWLRDNKTCSAKLRRNGKLIISAGPNSPVFLMKSGVGPANELLAAGFDADEIMIDNPHVGKHMQNHPILALPISKQLSIPVATNVPVYAGPEGAGHAWTFTFAALASGPPITGPYHVSGNSTNAWNTASNAGQSGSAVGQLQTSTATLPTASTITLVYPATSAVGPGNPGVLIGALGNTLAANSWGTGVATTAIIPSVKSEPNVGHGGVMHIPYGSDGLGALNIYTLRKAGLFFLSNGAAWPHAPWNPTFRGEVKIFDRDPLAPMYVDLHYLDPSLALQDLNDAIYMLRLQGQMIKYVNGGIFPSDAVIGSRTGISAANRDSMVNFSPGLPESTIWQTPTTVTIFERTNNVAKLTLSAALNLNGAGTFITVANVGDGGSGATFNHQNVSTVFIASPATATNQVTYNNPGPDVAPTAAPGNAYITNNTLVINYIRNAYSQNHHYLGTNRMVSDEIGIGGDVVLSITASSIIEQTNGFMVILTLASGLTTREQRAIIEEHVKISGANATVRGVGYNGTFICKASAANNAQTGYGLGANQIGVLLPVHPGAGGLAGSPVLTFNLGGVVDQYGNLLGSKNVMVVDTSALPGQVDANTATSCFYIALKLYEDLVSGRNPRA